MGVTPHLHTRKLATHSCSCSRLSCELSPPALTPTARPTHRMDAALHVAGMLEEGQTLWELPEARQRELEAEFERRRRDYELRQMVLTNSGEC